MGQKGDSVGFQVLTRCSGYESLWERKKQERVVHVGLSCVRLTKRRQGLGSATDCENKTHLARSRDGRKDLID